MVGIEIVFEGQMSYDMGPHIQRTSHNGLRKKWDFPYDLWLKAYVIRNG